MHRFDSGAVDLRHVRRVDENERDGRPERDRVRDVLQLEGGRPEAEHGDHEDRRHAAEQVCVRDREQPEGEEDGAGEAAQHGEEEREREDEDLRDAKDLHVQLERACDLRKRCLELVPVEERLAHFVPAGRMRDRDSEQHEDDDGREQRDRDTAAAVTCAEDARAAL